MTSYMSVNIGSTWTRYCIAQGDRVISFGKERTLLIGSNTSISRRIVSIYQNCIKRHKAYTAGKIKLGVSFAGLVQMDGDHKCGIAANICGGLQNNIKVIPNDWTFVDFTGLFHKFDAVIVRNDVVAEMIIEHLFGALVCYKHCAYLSWGTGIGSGLILDNKIVEGKRGLAGHAGHQFVTDGGKHLCGCGNTGDLESILGARAINDATGIDGKELFSRVAKHDPIALKQADSLITTLSRGVFNLLVILDLEAVCFGGTVFNSNAKYVLAKISQNMREFSPLFVNGLEFHQS